MARDPRGVARGPRWTRVDNRIDGFTTAVCFGRERWPAAVRIVVYRKRVFHRTNKNFQLDLFDPSNGTYEYSAVATNLEHTVPNLWRFMAGRGGHEKTLAELKQNCAFGVIPTNDRHANSAWQMLSVLALNLVRSFPIQIGAPKRSRSRKRTFAYVLQSLGTLRFELIHHLPSCGLRASSVSASPPPLPPGNASAMPSRSSPAPLDPHALTPPAARDPMSNRG